MAQVQWTHAFKVSTIYYHIHIYSLIVIRKNPLTKIHLKMHVPMKLQNT